MQFHERERDKELVQVGANLPVIATVYTIFRFSLSSLRGRFGQAIPVTLALMLIVGAAQAIGALRDVSSTLTRQQIAASWRGSADLLVRPSAAVSQPERAAGWINPQSVLDYYGGISAKQVASIASLSQVTQILPFATVGWRRVDRVTPVVFNQKGIYRVTARWTGAEQWAGSVVDYIKVSDLASLTGEEPILHPPVQHLILSANAASVIYNMSVPALQLLVGIASAQEQTLQPLLLQKNSIASSAHLTIRIDKLNGHMTMLPSCIAPAAQSVCWQSLTAQTGHVSYLAQDVQLLRYSQTHYSATSQQLAAGQLVVDAQGEDAQGYIYRTLLQQHLMLTSDGATDSAIGAEQQVEMLPITGPEHMAMLPGGLQFLPLAQACLVNGEQCYSGLYIRLRGVDQYNSKSLALLQATAAAITSRTGLHVDILDGSSTRAVTLVSSNAYNPLTATWRVVGVAVQIAHGVDALQNTLFVLCALICLLAIGAAGVLIGIGRRNEAHALEQLGWSQPLRIGVYLFDALLLALPGCVLAFSLIALASRFWPGNVPYSIMWMLLAVGVIIYGVSLVGLACGMSLLRRRKSDGGLLKGTRAAQAPPPIIPATPAPTTKFVAGKCRGGRGWEGWWGRLRRPRPLAGKSDGAFHTRITAPLVCGMAITATVFLITEEYLMVSGLNRELVVTVLGSQVRVALEGAQLLLLLLVLLTALLTIGLCTSLLLRGRRDELALLAKVGWEQRHVSLRLLKESWRMAALSGAAGALLALGVIAIIVSLPPLGVVCSALAGGPMLGVLLASLVVYTLARRELSSVYLKRA